MSVSALLGETGNTEFTSFHFNAVCCFANKHTKHVKIITWPQTDYPSLIRRSAVCTEKLDGSPHCHHLANTIQHFMKSGCKASSHLICTQSVFTIVCYDIKWHVNYGSSFWLTQKICGHYQWDIYLQYRTQMSVAIRNVVDDILSLSRMCLFVSKATVIYVSKKM